MFFKKKIVKNIEPPSPPVKESKWKTLASGDFTHILIVYILIALLTISVFYNIHLSSTTSENTRDLYHYTEKHEKRIQSLEKSIVEDSESKNKDDKITINNFYQETVPNSNE